MAGITYEIKKNLVSLNDGESDWNLELNLISWNNRAPKYDLRKWSPDHEKMGKGITLTGNELIQFLQYSEDIMNQLLGSGDDSHLPFD